jgi:D-alanyl-D-alanine carboxypeptidase (penicillin-binding protein 5/6)
MKKLISILIIITLFSATAVNAFAVSESKNKVQQINLENEEHKVKARSAVLMEAQTGAVLYSYNENERYSPASVTKIMTLLLIMEALKEGKISESDNVTVSEYASSMGGSQIFLEEGEIMNVSDLIKSTVIASANDAAVALAEHICGSEKLFVNKMNKRAKELGLENTYFENVTGLDDTTVNHLTSALDIALMSKELLKYETIKKYSSLWQDTVRNGEFTLTNTNRLVRYYDGCNGLKTGSTDKAGFCVSATAERDGLELIAVIMGAETRDIRNAEAKALLDFGFANYAIYNVPEKMIAKTPVVGGEKSEVELYAAPFRTVIEKGKGENVKIIIELPDELSAPIESRKKVGRVIYKLGDKAFGESEIYSKENVENATVGKLFISIIVQILH